MDIIRKILVPVSFSEVSLEAARYAAFLAQAHRAKLYLLHVKEPFPAHGRIVAGSLEDVQKHHIEKEKVQLSKVIPAKLKNTISIEEIQVTGMPVERVIRETARKFGVDLIVMTPQSRKSRMPFFKKNDMTVQIINDAPCSVLVFRSLHDRDTSFNGSDF